MREVDEALSRAFAQRAATRAPSAVPPNPHWSTRNRAHESESERAGGERSAASIAHGEEGSATSIVHSEEEAAPSVDRGQEALRRLESRQAPSEATRNTPALRGHPHLSESLNELHWPATVLMLECQWGSRFERLADRLIEVKHKSKLKILLFTSCHRAEGRTTLVLTLARALARRPGRTLLVDADLTGPMLSRLLGLRADVGLDDVVDLGQALAEALIEAPDDHLWILPLRTAVARPRGFLSSPGWTCAMARLRREFDLVLLDGSPLFTGLSAAVLHRSIDAAVLVHNRGMTSERSLLRAREVLDAGGIPLLGLAETFV